MAALIWVLRLYLKPQLVESPSCEDVAEIELDPGSPLSEVIVQPLAILQVVDNLGPVTPSALRGRKSQHGGRSSSDFGPERASGPSSLSK